MIAPAPVIAIPLVTAIYMIAATVLDLRYRDPYINWHPIVLMGKAISIFEQKFNHGKNRYLKGILSTLILTIGTIILSTAIVMIWTLLACDVLKLGIYATLIIYLMGLVTCITACFFSLSGGTLIYEVSQVFHALEVSLQKGRIRVARIVGRDTSQLNEQEVRTAALETLSENLSDGIVSPLFWCALLGLPGMLTYKMINTLDSMIGYKTQRYIYYGRFAAKLDDFVNYIPARLTAFLMVLASGNMNHFRFVKKYARCHTSPNSGYPESALAAILDCRFGGSHSYFGKIFEKPYIGCTERELTLDDLNRAILINKRVQWIMTLLATIVHVSLMTVVIKLIGIPQ